MQFSRKTDYAFILLEALKPTFSSGRFLSLRDVAEGEKLPFSFLEKIAATLKRKGVLEGRKGARGGFWVIRDPKKIYMRLGLNIFFLTPLFECF